ncbi:hypothetical protein ACFQJ7_00750 [Halovenus rubra]|uniref:DUF7260 domain-containing protein n=2 Tax=Halovenus rubra TaxID=869890 RepID=A0ABD5X3M2_9EURY|nr:hypothetical protein [Halovenus rubra]
MKTTLVDKALSRVAEERTLLRNLQAAFNQFEQEVRQLSTAPTGGSPRQMTDGGVTPVSKAVGAAGSGTDRCQSVCEVFAERVKPHSTEAVDGDEPVLETVRHELGDEVALALAPTTDTSYDKRVKQGILAASQQRRTEIEAMCNALDAEEVSVESARELVTVVEQFAADEEPLLSLSFRALQSQHEELAGYQDRIKNRLEQRQCHLHGSTGVDAKIGVTHLSLAEHLYSSFTSSYPVLSTLTQLCSCCQASQREVRDHLVRRV